MRLCHECFIYAESCIEKLFKKLDASWENCQYTKSTLFWCVCHDGQQYLVKCINEGIIDTKQRSTKKGKLEAQNYLVLTMVVSNAGQPL